jgi:hypothetical protein
MKRFSLRTDIFIESTVDVSMIESVMARHGVEGGVVKDEDAFSKYSLFLFSNKKKKIKKVLKELELAADKEDLKNFMSEIEEKEEEEKEEEEKEEEIPSLSIINSDPIELISGVRKNGSFYIAIHGTSFNDIKDFVKIPDSIIEDAKGSGNINDIAAVIDFAIKNVKSLI